MDTKHNLNIAICGIRGIPACYGGFETFAEELAPRLVELGHRVTVYGRKHVIDYKEPFYKGVRIKLLPAPRQKYLETPVHGLLCLLDCIYEKYDVVLVCNAANSPFVIFPRLCGIPVLVNVDGIERQRAKWNKLGKAWYVLGEKCSVLFASRVVSDADVIADYYKKTHNTSSAVVPYGCCRDVDELVDRKVFNRENIRELKAKNGVFSELSIEPGNYILYVSRLEPENNAHVVIEAYNSLPELYKTTPLVIVGDAPYSRDYISMLKEKAAKGVLFAGYRFGEAYRALQVGAKAYIQATEVGGTHPALVEAMGFGNCIIANTTPENVEVLAGAGFYYEKNSSASLSERLVDLLSNEEKLNDAQKKALQRARTQYDWSRVAKMYESLFHDVVR